MKLLSIWSVNIVSALKILYNNFTSTRVDVINKGDGMYVQDHERRINSTDQRRHYRFLSGASS